MKFQIHAGGSGAGTLTDNVLYLRGDGNVGIGTDTPVYNLDVDGDIQLRGQGLLYHANETSDSEASRFFLRFNKTLDASYPMLCNRTPNGDVVIATGTSTGGNDVERMRFNGGDGTRDIEVTNANFIVSGNLTAGTIDASKISNATVGDSTGGVKAVYFDNTENNSTYYTDKNGILAFDENFHPDTEYGTGTYDPSSTFVGGNGGGLLIKNEDGWGAIFTSQNTRWAKGYWNSLDVSGGVTATTFTGALSTSVTPGSYLTGSAYNGSTARTFAVDATTTNTASKIVARDSNGDIFARLFRSDYQNQNTCTGAIAFRTSTTDNYIRFCSDMGAVRSRIGCAATAGTASQNFSANTIYIGNSTSRGLRSVSGNYGTVQTTGGGAGGWEGYSINGRYVFMSADNNSCGIYNDLDNEWMVYCYRNSYTKLYFNGSEKLETINTGVTIKGNGKTTGSFEADGRIYADNGCHVRGDWLRVNSTRGIYFESYGGGWFMQDTTYVRVYNNKRIYTGGDILAGGNVTAYSDIRRKKDLLKIDNALNKVKQLTGYTYTNKLDNKRYTGLIAQDVQKVLPEAVHKEELDGHLSLAYGNMMGLLVEAVKELTRKNEILEARLNAIENNT